MTLTLALKNDRYLRRVIYVFLVAVAVKAALSLQFPTPWIFADETVYSFMAETIWKSHAFPAQINYLAQINYYPPGYPLLLSFAYAFQNRDLAYHMMLFVNAVVSSLVIFPAYFISKFFSDRRQSFLVSAALCFLAPNFLYSFAIMSENAFIPCFLVSCWLVIQSFNTANKFLDLATGFSLLALLLIRATGLAMVASLLILLAIECRKQGISRFLRRRIFLLASLGICLVLWAIITNYGRAMTNYNPSGYVANAFSAVSNQSTFLGYVRLFINELDYLVVGLLFIFFVLALLVFLYRSHVRDKDRLSTFWVYTAGSTLFLALLTVDHMGLNWGNPEYAILGRFMDPVLPALFLLGTIGLDLYERNRGKQTKPLVLIMSAVVLLVLALTFPHQSYKFPNMLSIYYIQDAQRIAPFWLLFAGMAGVAIAFVLSRRFRAGILVLTIVFSAVTIAPTYLNELTISLNTEQNNTIGRWLEINHTKQSVILFDRKDFHSDWGQVMWYLVMFWSGDVLVRRNDLSQTSSTPRVDDVDYIISKRLLPYHIVTAGKSWFDFEYKLYDPHSTGNDSVTSFIEVGRNDTQIIEGFYGAERSSTGSFRWTTNMSKVRISYPSENGPMKLLISIGNTRPETAPAFVELRLNGHSFANFTHTSARVYQFTITTDYLAPFYQMLEIRSNTWNPQKYGSQDNRELGLVVYWIRIESVESLGTLNNASDRLPNSSISCCRARELKESWEHCNISWWNASVCEY
jgi:hypothetical protein